MVIRVMLFITGMALNVVFIPAVILFGAFAILAFLFSPLIKLFNYINCLVRPEARRERERRKLEQDLEDDERRGKVIQENKENAETRIANLKARGHVPGK